MSTITRTININHPQRIEFIIISNNLIWTIWLQPTTFLRATCPLDVAQHHKFYIYNHQKYNYNTNSTQLWLTIITNHVPVTHRYVLLAIWILVCCSSSMLRSSAAHQLNTTLKHVTIHNSVYSNSKLNSIKHVTQRD